MQTNPSTVQCPLCHQANQCQVSQAQGCWCFATPIPKALIELLNSQEINTRCICFSCVEKFNRDPQAYAVSLHLAEQTKDK